MAGGTSELSNRDPSVFELIAGDDLAETGVLADNIALNIVMSTIDPNNDDDPPVNSDLAGPDADTHQREDTVYGTVVIYRDDTLDNPGATDAESLSNLLDDINAALLRCGFKDITASLDGSNQIVFSSPYAFEMDVEQATFRAEAPMPADILTGAVSLDITVENPAMVVSTTVTIPVDGTNGSLEDLYEDVAVALRDSAASDVYVRLLGDTLEFYSCYKFTIEGTSTNADLLGLDGVAGGTTAYSTKLETAANPTVFGFPSIDTAAQEAVRPQVYYRVQPNDSMVNGRLSDDITLDLSLDSGTYVGSITILAEDTNGVALGTVANTGIADLVIDINAALADTDVPGHPGVKFGDLISVSDESGVLVFTSDHDFVLTSGAGDQLDQLGFGEDTYSSSLVTPDYEVEGVADLPNDGILTDDVTLLISIDDGDGGTWTATVTIAQSDTATNTGISDLVNDIQDALVATEVLDSVGQHTGAYASQFLSVVSRSDRLVLSSERAFTIDGDNSSGGDEIGLTILGPGSDAVAAQPSAYQSLFPYDTVTEERISLPASRGLTEAVTLDLRIAPSETWDADDIPFEPWNEITVTIPVPTSTEGTTLDDLVTHINTYLPAQIEAVAEDGFIIFKSDFEFHIEYSSENEHLLGLVDMSNEQIDANRASNNGVLVEDSTFVLWVNLGTQKIVGEVTLSAADTWDNADGGKIMDLMLDLQESLNTATFYNLDGDLYGNSPDELFSDDPLTVGGVADPIVQVKLENGKILLAGQYEMKLFSSFSDPDIPGGLLESDGAEQLGFDTVAAGDTMESTRPFNIIAAAAGSEVIFGSVENPAGDVYIAGSVLSDHQITMVEGPDTNLDLDWSALLQTVDGSITLDLGDDGFLKGDLIAGGDEGDVILTANDTLVLNGEILVDREISITAGSTAADSITIAPTAWLRTNSDPTVLAMGLDQRITIDGYNNVIVNGPIGSLQNDDARMEGDVEITSAHGDLTVTEESGWIETAGRIVLTSTEGAIDMDGVIKNASASAPEAVGTMAAEHYEVVFDAATTLSITGDVDAVGSVLIDHDSDFTLEGSVEAGGMETFHFYTEERGFIDGGDERVTIQAPNITIGGMIGIEGADGTDEDTDPGLNEGDTYPLGANITASGLIELLTTGSITIAHASELYVRHDDSDIYLEADSVNVMGTLYAGADPARDLTIGDGSFAFRGENAGIEIQAVEMVYFGGDDTATDLDVLGGDAENEGDPMVRAGHAQATGLVTINVSGGTTPIFYLNESSTIRTDADLVTENIGSPSAFSSVSITTDSGINIYGVIQASDAASDVTLVSGDGLLLVSGFVEAGDQLTLTGATAASSSDMSVHVTKLLYTMKTREVSTTLGETISLTIDEYGRLINDYGFLIAQNVLGQVIVDGLGTPQLILDGDSNPVLGGMPIYMAQDDSEVPFYADKEGYQLAEYYELLGGVALPISGQVNSTITIALSLDDGLGNTVTGPAIQILPPDTWSFSSADELVTLINSQLDASAFSDVNAELRDGKLVLAVAGSEISIDDGTSTNLGDLGLDASRDTYSRFFYVDAGGQLLDQEGFVVNPEGMRLDNASERVNEYGYLIDQYDNFLNEYGDPINAYGDRVDQYGNLIADDQTTLISSDGYKVNEDGLLLNASDGLLNGVGVIYGSVDIGGTDYLTNQYGNLISSSNELITEISGIYYLVNERGELIDEDGIPIVGFQEPVEAEGNPITVNPATLEEPVGGYERWNEGSIQLGDVGVSTATPFMATDGKVLINLPDHESGGVLNTTSDTGEITITGDKTIRIDGMVGLVRLDDSVDRDPTVDVTEIHVNSLQDVRITTDALVNSLDHIDVTGTDIWAMDESVTITRAPYSDVVLTANGAGPDSGKIHVARSQIYYFRAYIAAQGNLELNAYDIGVYGTIAVEGSELNDTATPPNSLLQLNADRHILVRGELLAGGDADLNAGQIDSAGSIVVSAEGRVVAGYNTDAEGNITLDAPGEVSLLAYDDTMNDDLQFASPYVTYEPVYVDVVTGYRRVEAGFVMRPVYHWIPTITTEQTGFDEVTVGSEFGSVETRLVQDGYYKNGFGTMDLEDASAAATFLAQSAHSPSYSEAGYLIWEQLSTDTQTLLDSYSLGSTPSKTLQEGLIDDFNAILADGIELYDADAFEGIYIGYEATSLISQNATGSDLMRLNRLLIQAVVPGIAELSSSVQFREYFIEGVDYNIDDLDWPGKWSSDVAIYVPWLESGTWILPTDMSDDAIIARQLFEQVVNYASPIVDPEIAYAEGATVTNLTNELLAENTQPALFINSTILAKSAAAVSGSAQYYADVTYSDVYLAVTNAVYQGTQYKTWDDLTDSERVEAILDYTGYEKLFDMEFLSGFERTVYVSPELEVTLATDQLLYDAVDGLSMYQIDTLAQSSSGSATMLKDSALRAVDSGGTTTYAFNSTAAASLEGILYEYDNGGTMSQAFIPGTFVDGIFQVTPSLSVVDTLAASNTFLELDSYDVQKTYFDFWFPEFEPFVPSDPGLSAAEKAVEALEHWIPPQDLYDEALMAYTDLIPDRFLDANDELAWSDDEAADYAAIKNGVFISDGTYMTLVEALDIYDAFTSALTDVADDFFIAGIDYDEDYSNPDKSEYIASFFAREDTILSDGNWNKLYSTDEGLGRINRNLEGIPTANFWDLDFTDATRAIVYHELDDGTDIYINAPKDWWETYTVSTLGNDRTDSDTKTLQYVGNVETYDETVGYVREVAQLEYTQSWSWAEETSEPSNPEVGDEWVVDDYDDSAARWVVSYREDASSAWTDEYTAYKQYSIFDGRETDEAILPYVASLYTGMLQILANSSLDTSSTDLDIVPLLSGLQAVVSGLNFELLIDSDQSVKVPWDPTEWDLGDAGEVDSSGKLVYSIEEEGGTVTYYETTDSGSLDGSDELTGTPSGTGVFEGNNWDFGVDANGLYVFGQKNVGNDVLAVAQNGVTLELISTSELDASVLATVQQWLDTEYRISNGSYTWGTASTLFDYADWYLAVINDSTENALVRSIANAAGAGDVWLGGYDVFGTTHNSWSLQWVDGTMITANSGYSNFEGDEPNDLNDEDHLMMWPSGEWNDVDEDTTLRGAYERDPRWSSPYTLDETWEDYIYKMKTEWESIEDVRTDITYRVFTEAHDIVDSRPRYETIESEVPVIKMEQVTNWAYEPVYEQQLAYSSSVVTPDGPLDLSVFDLDTLSASGNITITAAGNILAKASIDAHGDDSAITIESTGGDVQVGDDLPENPMIYDVVEITATDSIEIIAAGSVSIGESATLETTETGTDVPDIAVTAEGGTLDVEGTIVAAHAADLSADGDITVTGQVTAQNSIITVNAGTGGTGSVFINREEGNFGGVLKTLGTSGSISITAGATSGDISLLNADVETDALSLVATAGEIVQISDAASSGETIPTTGGLLAADTLVVNAANGITLENTAVADFVNVTTTTGDIAISNVGYVLSSEGSVPTRPSNVTLTNVEATDGAITIETMAETLTITNVATLTDSDDNDITITASAAGTSGVAVELHDLQAAGAGDVTLIVEGSITHPDGLLVADTAIISAFSTTELRTDVNRLEVKITGDGDLTVDNTSADLVLGDIDVSNGNITVQTTGNLTAENVVLRTDWNTTLATPAPNVISLEADGEMTVISVTGGIYAASPEEADEIRLSMINALLANIDMTGIPSSLRGILTDDEGNPVLDEEGLTIEVVKLDMSEAQDLSVIVSTAMAASADPNVLYEADFPNGSTMTGSVAFLIYTRLLDELGIAYESVFEDDGSPEWTLTRQERTFSEATDLLTFSKQFTSQGVVQLRAGGGIVGGTTDVAIVAGTVSLEATNAITGLRTAVNTIDYASSLGFDAIDIEDIDGYGELTPGLELNDTEGGSINVTAQNGFIVDHITSHGATNTVALTSTNYNLFVRESGGSIHAEGQIVLDAAGDLVVRDNLIAAEHITLSAGGYLSTFEKQITLDAPALTVSAGGSVNLMGHIDGLTSLDIESTGNVNLLSGQQDAAGFNVYVQSVADQQALMQELNTNLQSQAQITTLIAQLETILAESELGTQEVIEGLSGSLLQDLIALPLDVQNQQIVAQYQAFAGLLASQASLPDTIEEMTLDLGGGETLTYADLTIQKGQVTGEIDGFQSELATLQTQIAGVSASELGNQLLTVRDSLSLQRSYLQDLESLMVTVSSELYARGSALPDAASSEAPTGFDPASLAGYDFSTYTDTQLQSLYGDILAIQTSVDQQLGTLTQLESQVLYQMSSDPDTLAWVDRQLDLIATAPTTLADLDTQISNLTQMLETLQTIISYGQGSSVPPAEYYDMIDANLRSLLSSPDAVSPALLPLLADLETFQPYENVQSNLSSVNYDIYQTDQALIQVANLVGETDYILLDDGLRLLQEYVNVLSEAMQSNVSKLASYEPLSMSNTFGLIYGAESIVTDLLDESDLFVIDSGLRDLSVYTQVLSGNLQETLPALVTLHPTKLATQDADLQTVDGVISWRETVGDLDSYPVAELITSIEEALSQRFGIDPYKYDPLPKASYEYDSSLGGAMIVYEGGKPTILVASLNEDLFYSRYITDYDLLNFWVGLKNGEKLLGNFPSSEILGSGYGDGQIDELIQKGLLNLNIDQLYQVRSAVNQSISETVLLVEYINKQLPTEQGYLQEQLLPWNKQLSLLDTAITNLSTEETFLLNQLADLSDQKVVLQTTLGEIEDILVQSWPTLPDEELQLGDELAEITSRRDTINSDYLTALQQEIELQLTQANLQSQLDILNGQADTVQSNLTASLGSLTQLDGYETQMAIDLAVIVQGKWNERYGLADGTLPTQQIEADILRVAQDLRHSQGQISLESTIDAYRDLLESRVTEIDGLQTQRTTLQTAETTLRTQLAAAQATVEQPTSIRIVALGMTNFIETIGPNVEFTATEELNSSGSYDGQHVVQDPSSGFYLYEYEDNSTGEYFYRKVSGMSTDSFGEPQYIEDNADDVFYVWPVALEQSGSTWSYRDVSDTPDDSGDDVLYTWQGGTVPEKLYPIDSTLVIRRYRDTTTETRYETRLNDQGEEETVSVTIESDRFYINDYRYRLLASAVTETGEPDLQNGELYVLDTENGTVVDLETMISNDEGVSLSSAVVLMPGQTLADLGIDELGPNDVLIRFSEFTPVFTPLSFSEFTFVDPEAYSGVEVEEVPTLFTELIHDGRLVVPVVEVLDGNVNLEGLSLAAVDELIIQAANEINGLDFGEAFSANTISIESGANLHVGSQLLGGDLVEISTTGDLIFDDGALVEANLVELDAANLTSAAGGLVVADAIHVLSDGGVSLYGDASDYTIDVLYGGDVWVSDLGSAGTTTFSHVLTPSGDVTVLTEATVRAGNLSGDNISITAAGDGAIELAGVLETYNSVVTLDAARAIVPVDGTTPSVIAEEIHVSAGLDVTVDPLTWGGEVDMNANLSILIGPDYSGPLVITAPRDIIIDTEIVADTRILLNAENIIFTENGSIRNPSQVTTLNATNAIIFPGETTQSILDIPTIEGSEISIIAGIIEGSEKTLISGDTLSIVADQGFGLRTAVQSLEAEILGAGNLRIESLTSIELTDINVFDGDLEVLSPGNIIAGDVTIATDRYSNRLSLVADGTVSLEGVYVGQTVELDINGSTPSEQTDNSLIVTVSGLDDAVYQGEETSFQVTVSDPSRSFVPDDGMVDLLIDFGDGSAPELVTVPFIVPEAEIWGEPSLIIEGASESNAFGQSIASGDLNGDGYSDLILGDGEYGLFGSDMGVNSGRVVVYYGSASGLQVSTPTTLYGWTEQTLFGQHIAYAGDVNNDGYGDVLISSPGKTTELPIQVVNQDGTVSTVTQTVRGEVALYLGSSYGLSQQPVWSSYGLDEYDDYGTQLSTAGDVNGDGFDDVLIGSPRGGTEIGTVQLFLGNEMGLASEAAWTGQGNSAVDQFGDALASVGDIDGDGFDDVMIGAPGEQNGTGAVYLFRGSPVFGLHEEAELVLMGDESGIEFGSNIAALGDVNNDGFDDIAITAENAINAEAGLGEVWVYFGEEDAFTSQPMVLSGRDDSGAFGQEVAGAGDVNGDGYDDMLIRDTDVSNRTALDRVILYLGSADGFSTLQVEVADAISTPTADGAHSIAGMGDFNGDGLAELVVGDPQGGETSQGNVWVFEGQSLMFEDALVAIAENVSHVYAQYGAYTLTVSVPEFDNATPIGSMRVVVQGPPLAQNDQASTNEDTPATILVSGLFSNDIDPDAGDILSLISLDTTNTVGTVTDLGDGILQYNPNGLFDHLGEGNMVTDEFSYVVSDAHGGTGNATVVITVYGTNDAPTAIALSNDSISENLPAGTSVGEFSTDDVDTGDTFDYTLVGGTGDTDNDKFVIEGNELKTLTPLDYGTQLSCTIRVRATDSGGLTIERTFTITIQPDRIPGDANNDGKVDGSDVTILAANWQAGVPNGDPENVTWSMGDFNGDGKVDGSDVTILAGNWQAGVNSQIPGDANNDGRVDGSDVTILAANWQYGVTGTPNATWSMGDFNGDGKVDGSDVTILAGNWQTGVDAAVVATSTSEPEASSPFIPPATTSLGIATVPQRESLPTRRFITRPTSQAQAIDTVLAESAWSDGDFTAIAKDLASTSKKKSTDIKDELFALDFDPYADLE